MYTEITEKKFKQFKKSLENYIGEEKTKNLIEYLGEENIKSASFATTSDTGMAYEGSLLDKIIDITTYAVKINELLPEDKRASKESLVKVGLLSHLSKVVMFTPNTNSWEIEKRGMVYTFAKTKGALRAGERSLLIAFNNGITFDEYEYEAMRILDKTNEDDIYSKYHSSVLSTVIKQANEIILLVNKKD